MWLLCVQIYAKAAELTSMGLASSFTLRLSHLPLDLTRADHVVWRSVANSYSLNPTVVSFSKSAPLQLAPCGYADE